MNEKHTAVCDLEKKSKKKLSSLKSAVSFMPGCFMSTSDVLEKTMPEMYH